MAPLLSKLSALSLAAGLVAPAAAAAFPQLYRRQNSSSSIPQFVLDYAPLVYLESTDPYRPSDLQAQLDNTTPYINLTQVDPSTVPSPLTLSNLDQLNNIANGNSGYDIYLGTNGTYTELPGWLNGVTPDSSGQTEGIVSCAVVVHDKTDVGDPGTVDAYYFYFFAYNQGNSFADITTILGDHLGDWEHNMVRFVNGQPTAMWFSQHEDGAAYEYSAVQKNGQRPISYSANGTHANYATSGTHDHTIPDIPLKYGLLVDTTDQGPLWDPVKAAYFYSATFPSGTSDGDSGATPTFSAYNGQDPTQWLEFNGQWGDDQLPDDYSGQTSFFGNYKYSGGPNGPKFKDLNRDNVCPDDGSIPCIVLPTLLPGS